MKLSLFRFASVLIHCVGYLYYGSISIQVVDSFSLRTLTSNVKKLCEKVKLLQSVIVISATCYAGAPVESVQASFNAPESQLIDLFQRTTPSVVYIDTYSKQYDIFTMNVFELPAGTGSGRQSHELCKAAQMNLLTVVSIYL